MVQHARAAQLLVQFGWCIQATPLPGETTAQQLANATASQNCPPCSRHLATVRVQEDQVTYKGHALCPWEPCVKKSAKLDSCTLATLGVDCLHSKTPMERLSVDPTQARAHFVSLPRVFQHAQPCKWGAWHCVTKTNTGQHVSCWA